MATALPHWMECPCGSRITVATTDYGRDDEPAVDGWTGILERTLD